MVLCFDPVLSKPVAVLMPSKTSSRASIIAEDAVITATRDNLVLSWNGGAERMTGYAAREAIGKNLAFLFSEKHREIDALNVRDALSGIPVRNSLVKAISKSGQVTSMLYSLLPMTEPGGRVVGILRICKDLSAFRDARLSLSRVLDELRNMDEMHDEVHRAVAGDTSGDLGVSPQSPLADQGEGRVEFFRILRDEVAALTEQVLAIRAEVEANGATLPSASVR